MKINLHDFEGVGIDFDGTLADTVAVHTRAREAAFTELGLTGITPEQHAVGHRHGNNPTTIIAGILKAGGLIGQNADPFEHPLVADVVQKKTELFNDLMSEGVEAKPGALAFVKLVAQIYGPNNIAIVTNSPLVHVDPFIAEYGLYKYFDYERIVSEDTAKAERFNLKPAKDMYVYTAELLGMSAANMLVVEDSTGGVVAGKDAGCPVLALGTTNPREIFFAQSIPQHPDYFENGFFDLLPENLRPSV